ncbi:CaiB/BaiF CoA transferase family protein [Pseudonocardia endophytica]|uniref:Crotonobetainyl-CoA:carnitine CoA-transferase CaiB-like acyl-CoA transferase n=1 Tax=Pseudonocardia endophytica TaxID=401976 RepID=A0A4R1I0W1_PSEEN|nr:CaiB/BaiF CoA-transferase family protein [Pseudonocardia endophytica]TCK27541.1 crotonobetainyl-CoA:carnitine CoA-transferase CaiB-like acyl-CoA transferase [Pseudonocardia endophytica]
MTPAPLQGYRVVSLAEQYPGPFATMLLADLGADVVQVERPAGGDPARAFPGHFAALGRGKRSVALDLKTEGGRIACRALVDRADVLLEGFRPGVLARLGLDPAELTVANPGLVVVSISGFGQDGPHRDRPAHDLTFQALAGLLDPAAPAMPGMALADVASGLFAAVAALSGLAGRGTSGRGGHYDVAMLDSLLAVAATRLVPAANGMPPDELGEDPGYGLFATSDGRWISLSIAFEDHFWHDLCVALDLPDLADVPGAERIARRAELRGRLGDRFATYDLAHWEIALAGVPCVAAVRGPAEVLDDPQLADRGLLARVGGEVFLRQPLVVDGDLPGPERGVPGLGEHTDEVLREAGIRIRY